MILTQARLPKYRQIAEGLRRQMRSRELAPGASLPSYRQLMDEYGVTVATVRQAMQVLQHEGLVTSRPRIGCVVTDQEAIWSMVGMAVFARQMLEPVILETLRQIHDELDLLRCHLSLRFVEDESEASLQPLLHWGQRLDGVLLQGRFSTAAARVLSRRCKAVVLMGDPYDQPAPMDLSAVTLDVAGVMRLAVSHLASLGHRRVLFLTHRGSWYFERLRESFHQCMTELIPSSEPIEWNFSEPPIDFAHLAQRIASMDRRPTALLVDEGSRASDLLRQLRKLGLDAPRDMSLLTLTANINPSVMMPDLTAVLVSSREMTVRAAAIVQQLLRSQTPMVRNEHIVPVFVPGNTCRSLTDAQR